MAQEKQTTINHNVVHEDHIWRSLIQQEFEQSLNWEKKWGFMKDDLSSKGTDIQDTNDSKSGYPSGLPSKRKGLTKEITENNDVDNVAEYYLRSHKVRNLQLHLGKPLDKYFHPPTGNSTIGWWSQKQALEREETLSFFIDQKLGKWARGQRDFGKAMQK
jgi:hypothetical protein